MTTPNGAPEWASGQATPDVTVNEAIRRTERGAAFYPVVDKDLTSAPGSCADGAVYIVAANGGGWSAGTAKDIAVAVGVNAASGWYYRTPEEGMFAWAQDENLLYYYTGSVWAAYSAGSGSIADDSVTNAKLADMAVNTIKGRVTAGTGDPEDLSASQARTVMGLGTAALIDETTTAQYRANTADKALSTDQVWAAADYVALTDAATVAVDMSTGFNFSLTIGGNRTLGAPSNTKNGQTGAIVITQDGTGSRTLAYHANWKFAGGTDPTLSTAAGAVDVLFYQVISSTSIIGNLVKAIA